jgi:hypothetical protein
MAIQERIGQGVKLSGIRERVNPVIQRMAETFRQIMQEPPYYVDSLVAKNLARQYSEFVSYERTFHTRDSHLREEYFVELKNRFQRRVERITDSEEIAMIARVLAEGGAQELMFLLRDKPKYIADELTATALGVLRWGRSESDASSKKQIDKAWFDRFRRKVVEFGYNNRKNNEAYSRIKKTLNEFRAPQYEGETVEKPIVEW